METHHSDLATFSMAGERTSASIWKLEITEVYEFEILLFLNVNVKLYNSGYLVKKQELKVLIFCSDFCTQMLMEGAQKFIEMSMLSFWLDSTMFFWKVGGLSFLLFLFFFSCGFCGNMT